MNRQDGMLQSMLAQEQPASRKSVPTITHQHQHEDQNMDPIDLPIALPVQTPEVQRNDPLLVPVRDHPVWDAGQTLNRAMLLRILFWRPKWIEVNINCFVFLSSSFQNYYK